MYSSGRKVCRNERQDRGGTKYMLNWEGGEYSSVSINEKRGKHQERGDNPTHSRRAGSVEKVS